ncbi:MAG: hypothetical protein OEL55_03755, partial [Desulfobulbaceae bacterium]|nr:hypothetical protein [Desulfobulbaceae bacterium]
MAKSKKKPRRKARRIPLRLLASLLVSLAIVATIGYVLYRQQPVKTSPVITKTYKPVTQPKQPPLAKPLPPPIPIITQKPPVATTARFALVIDDMGYHKKIGDALLGLPLD